ncbi:MAG: hypothetical protein UT48_C0001G0100 [Parcubacteria group bacterium GW2011_GWE2_39_37]|uniref:Uncharacterized protein n=1 Tax=Candidatus Falkowbacteria bacterium GW2011_GWF2_39_8 TaxID=1618642 RepID=A0A0G0PTE9_9BACT|nr:MAG: hypothetical protein UT48_C0001G0100 [Parcubacteria group bacterium GW2011_GWE2_39_37]KKR31459.1 MAG: hypothetical protein UT64_C0060G0002 [Candidatus Falkowbacteria bacterium GW2011_GWF2_39_8]
MKESYREELVHNGAINRDVKYVPENVQKALDIEKKAISRRTFLKGMLVGGAAIATGAVFNAFDKQDKALEQEKLNAKEQENKSNHPTAEEVTIPQIKTAPNRNDGKPGVGGYDKDIKI